MRNTGLTGDKLKTLILVGLVILFLFLAMLHMLGSSTAGSFPKTTAYITAKSVGRKSLVTWAKPMTYDYAYTVEGRRYTAVYRAHDQRLDPLRKFTTGSTLNVYYFPLNPAISTIAPGFFDLRYLGFLLLYAATTFVIVALRVWKKLREF